MKVTNYKISEFFQTVELIAKTADKWKEDSKVLDKLSLKDIHNLFVLRYSREKGEIIQRPKRFFEFGMGDCDCQATAFIACLLWRGYSKKNIFISLAGRQSITHVFPLFLESGELLGADMLPGRNFGTIYLYPVQEFYVLSEVLKGIKNPINYKELQKKIKQS